MSIFFNYAQTLYLDASVVSNAQEVAITKIDLYFRAKPPAENNKSGIVRPGVEVLVVPCLNGIPVINQMGAYRPTEPTEHGAKFAFYSGGQVARVEYDEILASSNAEIPTSFLLSSPAFVKTNEEYAIIIKFDGNENFVLWTSKQGDLLVGTDKPSPGPSGKFIGNLYTFIDNPNKGSGTSGYAYTNNPIDNSTSEERSLQFTPSESNSPQWDSDYLQSNWSPLPNQDLKFRIHVARYYQSGRSVMANNTLIGNTLNTSSLDRVGIYTALDAIVSNNVTRVAAPCQTSEYILFDSKDSTKFELFYGEPVYQGGPMWPGGTATPLTVNCAPAAANIDQTIATRRVVANGSYVLAGNTTFESIGGFNQITKIGDMMVFEFSNNTVTYTEGRTVVDIVSNTELLVDQEFPATLIGAQIRFAPIGFINDMSRTQAFGRTADLLTLYNSIVNTSIRFVGHSINAVSIANGGTGYANSDYIRINGYEDVDYAVKGNYPAYANVVTNANGTITAIYVSNSGAGFVNTAWLAGTNVAILKSQSNGAMTNTASDGINASLTFDVGSYIKSLASAAVFRKIQVVNLEATRMKPEITVNNPLGTVFNINHRTQFYSVNDANTFSGKGYYVHKPDEQPATDTPSKIFKSHKLKTVGNKTPVIPSRSNELILRYSDGGVPNNSVIGQQFSNAAVFLFDISSNNDFSAVYLDPEIVNSHYSKYVINREYTNEHTNYGAAFAKHVGTKTNFVQDRFAEDILVYLTAYRPANTDIKVYARIHNSNDEEAFDDKDWTLLELVDGVGVYSSQDNDADYIELTYNLPAYPNTDFTLAGSVTVTQGNAHISGNGTAINARANLIANGTGYTNGDIIQFTPPAQSACNQIFAYRASANAQGTLTTNSTGGITAITITNGGFGWSNQSQINNRFAISNSTGGATGGSGANVGYIPGLVANDLIKIYSQYIDFANTNYTLAVVNSVTNATHITVKRTFGEVSANLVGNVNVGVSTTLNGDGTTFTSDFSVGDFIAVWANSSVYETRKISSITDANTLIVETAFSITNTATTYAYVTPDTFVNNSLNVSQLKVDRLAYKHQAFNNVLYDNVARYYSSSMVAYDGYDTVQLKIVLLGDNDIIVPKVDDVRGIFVTA